MSSPSSTNDLQAAHWPSLQPCMSMMPCSAAARRTVWSSLTSISMPTGSNRTVCFGFSAIGAPLVKLPRPAPPTWLGRGRSRWNTRPFGIKGFGLLARRGGTTRRALLDVVGREGRALLVGHLVEQHVGRLDVGHPTQVVERPHVLRVEVEVRLGDQRLAVVADVSHVGDRVGPVPAVVERLPLALADQLAHVRGLAALVGRPEGGRVGPVAGLGAVGAPLPV